MRERCIRFGERNHLNGIICAPANVDAKKPAVIILNSGIMHHVGACRMSVKIARVLAEVDTLSLRFDHAGVGDSEPHMGSEPFEAYAPLEVITAMDYLTKRSGFQRFILYGLCSGADMSYEAALLDDRVVGVIQIDAYTYRTPRFYFNYYWQRFFQWSVWRNFVLNRLPILLGLKRSRQAKAVAYLGEENLEMPSYTRVFPPRKKIESGVHQLIERQVALYFLFTGAEPHFNYPEQVEDMYPDVRFGDLLKVDYLEDCSHIIKEPHRQKDVCEGITEWVTDLNHRLQ